MNISASPCTDELVEFLDDESPAPSAFSPDCWKVLVVDDDAEVHQATEFALQGAVFCGRSLELRHAYSAAEARETLGRVGDVAVILLDVVMERHDAGLDLVRVIREELRLSDVRIILRTGQPGYAPELSVIREYDINDYRTKAELTHTRLVTTLTAAIRSYEQLCELHASRKGLEFLIQAGNQLFTPRDVRSFADAALGHLTALLGTQVDAAFIGPIDWRDGEGDQESLGVLAASGRYGGLVGQPTLALGDTPLRASFRQGLARRGHVFEGEACCLYLGSSYGKEALIHLDLPPVSSALIRQVIEVLCVNLRIGFENVVLFERLNFFACAFEWSAFERGREQQAHDVAGDFGSKRSLSFTPSVHPVVERDLDQRGFEVDGVENGVDIGPAVVSGAVRKQRGRSGCARGGLHVARHAEGPRFDFCDLHDSMRRRSTSSSASPSPLSAEVGWRTRAEARMPRLTMLCFMAETPSPG